MKRNATRVTHVCTAGAISQMKTRVCVCMCTCMLHSVLRVGDVRVVCVCKYLHFACKPERCAQVCRRIFERLSLSKFSGDQSVWVFGHVVFWLGKRKIDNIQMNWMYFILDYFVLVQNFDESGIVFQFFAWKSGIVLYNNCKIGYFG